MKKARHRRALFMASVLPPQSSDSSSSICDERWPLEACERSLPLDDLLPPDCERDDWLALPRPDCDSLLERLLPLSRLLCEPWPDSLA